MEILIPKDRRGRGKNPRMDTIADIVKRLKPGYAHFEPIEKGQTARHLQQLISVLLPRRGILVRTSIQNHGKTIGVAVWRKEVTYFENGKAKK